VDAGTDPLDADSRPYVGGWPFNPDKDALEDPGWTVVAREGQRVPRFVSTDQFGDTVDLYDFAASDVPVVIELTWFRCEACESFADQLSRQGTAISPAIADGRVWWIRVLSTNDNGDLALDRDRDIWMDEHPLEGSPLLLDDSDAHMTRFFRDNDASRGTPVFMQLDPDTMQIVREPKDSLEWLDELVDEVGG